MLTSADLAARAKETGVILVDGAMATELERRGHDLADPLWSAKILLEQPHAIETLHSDYLAAGADILITASYQATFPALADRGFGRKQAAAIIRRSVELARSALAGSSNPNAWIAASIGPYGAYLHDGSEYRGDYKLTKEQLADFHRDRLAELVAARPHLLACETIPCIAEAEALFDLLRDQPSATAWFSFCCRDGERIVNGDYLRDAAARLGNEPQVAAIGVNCTAPELVASLVGAIRRETQKPIVVYPNSGESWNAVSRCWTGTTNSSIDRFIELAKSWRDRGATLIGGCCRTSPEHIRRLKETIR